jgi:hypothetical protein
MFLGVSWTVWGGFCLVIAAVYFIVWPKPRAAARRSPWRQAILRYSHGLVWLFLALSCFVRAGALPGGLGLANGLALAALGCYALFMGAIAAERAGQRRRGPA